jgi:Kynureninase
MFERLGGPKVREVAERHFSELTDESAEEFMRVALPVYNPKPQDPDVIARTRLKLEVGNHFFRNEFMTADLLPELPNIRCPTLVLGGELDPITPVADSEDIAAAIPQAELACSKAPATASSATSRKRRSQSSASSSSDERPARVSRPLPDPRAHDVPDQPLARRDAGGGRRACARVRAHVGGAGHPRVGRGLVDDAADGRRPDRPHRRRARGNRLHAPERVDRRAVVLSCFQQPGERNRIVYERENFPSVRYVYQARSELDIVATDDVVGAIDERTLLVPVQHVLFKSGEIQDVASIVDRAHEQGAHVVLDAYQSAGAVPLDVTRSASTSRSAARSSGLRRSRCRLALRPAGPARPTRAVGDRWQARAAVRLRARARVRRWDRALSHRHPNVPALYACTPGYDLIEEIGVDRIRANSLQQTQRLIDGADARGFEVRSPREPERRGGTVTVHVPDFEAVHKELSERQILCDFRPDAGIRLGPHYFTSDEELDFALDQIAEILATGAHERWLGATARF